MQSQRPKRFWKQASVIELPAEGEGNQGRFFGVALDSRPVRAPSKQPLRLASQPLALAVAAEWDAQDKEILPHTMPLTQLANTAQDRMVPMRDEIIAELLKHVDADTLCYYAGEPQDLIDRQHATWTPITAWAQDRFGATWRTTNGIMPLSQEAAVHQAVAAALADLTADELAAYQVVAPVTASVLVGLAVVHGRLTADQAFTSALVEELFQAELWGEDYEAIDRWERIKSDLRAAEAYLALARAEG